MAKSIYLFYGEEDFLIAEAINCLKQNIPNPGLNVETFDGRELSLEALSSALCTQPLLGGEKLVVVKDFRPAADEQDKLISIIKGKPADIRVVFQAGNIDKRSKFYKLIDNDGEVVEFRAFAPWEQAEAVAWITDRVKAEGKSIDDEAARLLYEICGNNLRLLANEIEKIVTFIGQRTIIGEADVLALASAGETSAFVLLDALREKQLERTLAVFQILLKNKEDLFQLLGLITTQYRLMLQIKSLDRETDPNKIARMVGGSPFFVKKCRQGLERFSLAELKKNLELLLETGIKLKSGQQPAVVFELMLTALCGK